MASKLTEHKGLLWHLYIEKDLTAKQIAKYMEDELQVKHSEGVYQRAFRKWEFKKNCDGSDWIWLEKKQKKRKALGKETCFTFNNRIMDDAKIRKEISRNVNTVQQIPVVTTPRTPSGWAVITPAASTPGYEPSDSHTLRGESPVEQEANADTLLVAESAPNKLVERLKQHNKIWARETNISFKELEYFVTCTRRLFINHGDQIASQTGRKDMPNLYSFSSTSDSGESDDSGYLQSTAGIHENAMYPNPHTHPEEIFSSPHPYSRAIWQSQSPNPFYCGQSTPPRRVSSSEPPTLASSPNTELQTWASPRMPNPMF